MRRTDQHLSQKSWGGRTGNVRPGSQVEGARRRRRLLVLVELVLVFWLFSGARAGTVGKLSGKVTDSGGQPLVGATVQIVAKPLGAYVEPDGTYAVLNVPPGTYAVSFSYVGYQTMVVKDVVISADLTTRQDAKLNEAAVRMEEVVVRAERPVVDVNLTSSRSTMTAEQINQLPVQELQDVVNLQAGVVDGHFRGGRKGEVQYQIDGVSANNVYDNSTSLRVDRSLLQEVQVISGTFDAEYGQAMSGVVNAVLREGTPDFRWGGEVLAGGFYFPDRRPRLAEDTFRPSSVRSFSLGVSGPIPVGKTVFLLAGRRYVYDDYLRGTRRFRTTDRADFEQHDFVATGDSENVALGYSREWSGVAKVGTELGSGIKLGYQAIWNAVHGRSANWAYRFNPDGLTTHRTDAVVHGLDFTQTLSKRTFYSLNLRQTYWDYWDYAYEDAFDARYDRAGPAVGDPSYENGAIVQGVDFSRFHQRTNAFVVKGSLVTQATAEHNLKLGGEAFLPKVAFGVPEYLRSLSVGGTSTLVRYKNRPPDFPGVKTYYPRLASAFAQDQVEWTDLTLRAGLRLDYFDANATVPSDPSNPANSIAGAPKSHPRRTTVKTSLSPRLGVAYPVTVRAGLHFAYGHFYQFPSIGQIFTNADYGVLTDLQAGGISYGTLGNPDIRPERTVQYEFGFKYAITDATGLDVSFFYKDIRDLLGVEFVSMYNASEYTRLTNVDFGSVIGYTIHLDRRRTGIFSTSLDYTWQRALGNSSDPYETAVRASAGEDPRPRQVLLDWDQRHTLNLTGTLSRPNVRSISTVLRVASGQPYTPIIDSGFGAGLGANSGRKPAAMVVDLRGQQALRFLGHPMSAFFRVFNLFDSRFLNGFVFDSTGSPYYSRFPVTDASTLADPTRFYPPRRVEVGVTLGTMDKTEEEE